MSPSPPASIAEPDESPRAEARQRPAEALQPGGAASADPFAANPGLFFDADCPTRPILDQIADKWSLMVMAVLQEPTRFNEVKRRLDGVTQRVLTQTLRRLERNGMIRRTVLPTSPVGVEYSLTPLGRSLREPFGHLYSWAVENSTRIRASQEQYDGNVVTSGDGAGPETRPRTFSDSRGPRP